MSKESVRVDRYAGLAGHVSRRHVLQGALGAAAVVATTGRPARAQDGDRPSASDSGQLHVYPMPGSRAASPGTQLSFRGELPKSLSPIHVTGSKSGEHPGTQLVHSDGKGVSWFPDFAFRPGEEVSVRTRLDVAGADNGDFGFTCASPRPTRAAPERNDDPEESEIHRFRTRPGLVPPRIETELYEGETAPGYVFLAPKRGGGRNGALIVDDQGEPVWFFPVEVQSEEIYDFRVVEYQGEQMLAWWQGASVSGHGYGHWVIRNSAYEEVATVRIGNGFAGGDMHDLIVTPQDTALVGAYNTIRWDLTDVGGKENGSVIDSIIQEIDIATGAVMFEWHSLDHVALDESYSEIDEEDGGNHDYFHYNSVAIDEDDNLIICARNTWATYKIDRITGEIIWRLGGKRSDFEMGDGTEVAYQHDARPLGNGEISLYDNGASPKVHDESRGLVLALDMKEKSATLVREYLHPDGVSAGSQGNMQVLPNGNVLIGWGSEPLVSEFAPDGTLLFDLRLPKGKQSYRAYRFPWSGQSRNGPSLQGESNSDGGATLYVSWNGATEVAAWRALAGDGRDDLSPVEEPTARTGFETEITIRSSARYCAVEALDADGKVLGTSRTIEVSA